MKTITEIREIIAPFFSKELGSFSKKLSSIYSSLGSKLASLPYEEWRQELIRFESERLIPAVSRFCSDLGNTVPNKCAECGLIPQNRTRSFWAYAVKDLHEPIPGNVPYDLPSPDSVPSSSEKSKVSPAGLASLISGAGLSAASGIISKSTKSDTGVATTIGYVLFALGAVKLIYDAVTNDREKNSWERLNKKIETINRTLNKSMESVAKDVSDWADQAAENAAEFIYKIQDES